MTENTPPLEWSELTDAEREAILELARGRVFWKQAWSRVQWLKGAGTIILTLAAAWALIGDKIAELIQWLAARG